MKRRIDTGIEEYDNLAHAHDDLLEACSGLLEILLDCECDNTHKQNESRCRICIAREMVAKAQSV